LLLLLFVVVVVVVAPMSFLVGQENFSSDFFSFFIFIFLGNKGSPCCFLEPTQARKIKATQLKTHVLLLQPKAMVPLFGNWKMSLSQCAV